MSEVNIESFIMAIVAVLAMGAGVLLITLGVLMMLGSMGIVKL